MARIRNVIHPSEIKFRIQASINGWPVCPVAHAWYFSSSWSPSRRPSKEECMQCISILGWSSIFCIKWQRHASRELTAVKFRPKYFFSSQLCCYFLFLTDWTTSLTERLHQARWTDSREQKVTNNPGAEICWRYLLDVLFKNILKSSTAVLHSPFLTVPMSSLTNIESSLLASSSDLHSWTGFKAFGFNRIFSSMRLFQITDQSLREVSFRITPFDGYS